MTCLLSVRMGVSVESARWPWRIDCLRAVPAAVRFLSLEPLLGLIDDLPLAGIDWVIVGGVSRPGARPTDPAWVRSLREQCRHARVPFFFEQWGGVQKAGLGRELDARTWDEVPAVGLRKRVLYHHF